MALTTETRNSLPDSDFAVPGKRKLPMHDEKHVRLAHDMVDRTQGLTDEERAEARRRIMERAHNLGIDTGDWNKIKAMRFEAMSLAVPHVEGHPNRMPFSGNLVRIDSPSDLPPLGSGGRKIILSRAAAEKGLASLLGMGIDVSADLSKHDAQKKIGVITAATIASDALGEFIHIEGLIYASDFPDAAACIRAMKDQLGFSFEATQSFVADPGADPLVVTECVFTGAAILKKVNAAFHTTALAASRDSEGNLDMTKEEMQALLGDSLKVAIEAAVKPINDKLAVLEASAVDPKKLMASNLTHMVEPHAKALEACADSMQAAGIGADEQRGHATLARKMAGHLRASAATGHIPNIYRDHDFLASADKPNDVAEQIKAAVEAAVKPLQDQLAASDTKIADLKASAFNGATPPERKTISSDVQALLAKFDLKAESDGKISVAKLDEILAKSPMTREQKMEHKLKLQAAGLLA